jgi:putative repressor, phage associated
MKKENNYFSSNLKFLRQREGLDQVDLTKKLGRKSSASISEWEKGKYTPKASVLTEIATIFNVNLSELLMVDLANAEINKSNNKYSSLDLREMIREAESFDGEPLREYDKLAIRSMIEIYLQNR